MYIRADRSQCSLRSTERSSQIPRSGPRRQRLTLAVCLVLGSTMALGLAPSAAAQRFPATLPMSSLDGLSGFAVDGESAGHFSGRVVSVAGDVNGDGIDDLIVAARGDDPLPAVVATPISVIFGSRSGFPPSLMVSSLNGVNGFRIDGEADNRNNYSVSLAGDVNGDAIDDIIIGSRELNAGIQRAGRSYVVFGSRDGFPATLSLAELDGTNGFKLTGGTDDYSGGSVAAAGDVNNDGIDDLIIGAAGYTPPENFVPGRAYLVFGTRAGFPAHFSLPDVDGVVGFKIEGQFHRDRFGRSVDAAGDVNGDGIDDVIIGAEGADPNGSYSGRSYVVFGSNQNFPESLQASDLDGTNGFMLDGETARSYSGQSVGAAGDVNADGIDDLVIGAFRADANGVGSGRSYVVFGTRKAYPAVVALAGLDGRNGFKLDGEESVNNAGVSVGAAGDVNGDGIDDVIIGAYRAGSTGRSYVIFGQTSEFPSTFQLSSVNGRNGFRLAGEWSGDFFGNSVSAAGDVNGDGIGDLIIGAPGADINGFSSGRSYVVFGRETLFGDGFE